MNNSMITFSEDIDDNGLRTTLAVTLPIGVDAESLKRTLTSGTSFLDSPQLRSAVKIASYLSYLRQEGCKTHFYLNAQTLAQLMRRIDDIGPLQLGFYYDQTLQRECEFLLPRAVDEQSSVDELLRSFVSWRLNRGQLNCRMIGVALHLALISRIIRFDKKFLRADFSPMISGLETCHIEFIESAFNSAICRIANQENKANENA